MLHSSPTRHNDGSCLEMGAALDKDSEQEFNYLVPPSIIQPLHRASENALTLKELDDLERDTGPTLRTFLTAVNMERLEYRLKLIGIFTLFELSNHTTEQLVSKGFTELMARRLQRAFDDYVMNLPDDLEESAVQKTPFHVVRPNAVLPTTASTLMRKMINYGRKGVKRTSGVSQAQHVPTVIRLPTKSTLPTSLLTQPDEIGTPAEEGDQTDGIAHSPSPAVLIRTQSVPTNLHHDKLSLWSFEHQACISAPCLLMSELRTRNNTSLVEIVSKMEKKEEKSTDAILCYLYCLLDVLCVKGRKEEEVKMVERLLSVICHVFEHLGQCDEVIVIASRLLSCLTEFELRHCLLAEKVARKLAAALTRHPTSSPVQLWGSFSLYHIINSNKNLVCLVSECGLAKEGWARLPLLSNEAQVYLQRLLKLALS